MKAIETYNQQIYEQQTIGKNLHNHKQPLKKEITPLPIWRQVAGARVPNGAQGGEAPRGSGGGKPHAWERPRRGGDRWGRSVQPPLGAY